MKNKTIRKVFCFALLFLLVLSGVVSAVPVENIPEEEEGYLGGGAVSPRTPPEISAPSAILIESQRGQVLFQKNPTEKFHVAVICKLMTVLVVVDHIDKSGIKLDTMVTISKQAAELSGSTLALEAGAKYSLEDLLYAVTLTSANNAATALAEFIGKDVESFVKAMNTKAAELNMRDTVFYNPTGLYNEAQYTTAYDIAMLLKHAVNFPLFNQLISTRLKLFTYEDGNTQILKNQNDLFWSYDGVDGGKSGYNEKDRQSLVTTATRGKQRLICVLVDSPEKSVFTDTAKLLDYGFFNFKTGILVPKNNIHKTYTVGNKKVNLINIDDVYYTYPIGEAFIKEAAILNTPETLELPITTSRIVGTAKYILKDNTTIEVGLYPDIEVRPPDNFYTRVYKKISENRDIFLIVLVLLAVEVLLTIYHVLRLIRKAIRRSFSERKEKTG